MACVVQLFLVQLFHVQQFQNGADPIRYSMKTSPANGLLLYVWRQACRSLQIALALESLHRQGDETLDQLTAGDTAGFPEFRVQADFSEAGDGVDFVDEHFEPPRESWRRVGLSQAGMAA